MLKKYPRVKLFLATFDLLLLLLSLTVSFLIRYRTIFYGATSPFPWLKFFIYLMLLFPFIIIFRLNNLYKQRIFLSTYGQFIQISKSLLTLAVIFILFIFAFRNFIGEHSRSLISQFFLISLFSLCTFRIVIFRFLYKRIKGKGGLRRRIIVIGAGSSGSKFLAKVKENPSEDIEIIGFFDDDPKKKGKEILGVKVLGNSGDLNFYLKKLKIKIDGICICISLITHEALVRLINNCEEFGYPIYLDSAHFKVINDRVNVHEFESLSSPPIYKASSNLYKVYLKRLIDISFSSLALLILSPFFLIVSILVKVTSKGPVFYKRQVVGKDENEFIWYKFRTMKINQDPSEHNQFMEEMIKNKKKTGILKINNDKRVTKVGNILRKFSLDELPQLINVFKGQMSLIGPRPCSLYEYSIYEEWHKKRFSATPGMTGLWQAFGRSSVGYDDIVIMDLYYIENISFWLDLKIFIKTIPVVLLGRGAY